MSVLHFFARLSVPVGLRPFMGPLHPLWRPVRPLWRAARLWSDADGMRMSAAMSFYGILSLAPLLVLLVAVLGWWLDRGVLENGLVVQISAVVGEQGAAVIRQALASAREPAQGIAATLLGLLVLLFGATGVFVELQAAFERLWAEGGAAAAPPVWWHGASLRLRGIGYVLAFGFLLLLSLVISTLLNLFAGWAGGQLPLEPVVLLVNEVVAFGVCAALFLGLMRMSAGPKPRWRYLALGAGVGAILFTLGKHALAAYLAGAAVVSAYGAAGSLIVLLMWIYFSSAILLFAAGCARAVEEDSRVCSEREQRTGEPAPGLRLWHAASGAGESAGAEQASA